MQHSVLTIMQQLPNTFFERGWDDKFQRALIVHPGEVRWYARRKRVSLKLVLAIGFVFLANPVATHLLTRSALKAGIAPWTRGRPAERAEGRGGAKP